jgi:hypothetical protein
MQGEPTSV